MEYRAVAAMIAYTKIKKGEFENVPVEMTAAQVACIVARKWNRPGSRKRWERAVWR